MLKYLKTSSFDFLAVILSMLCLIHCLLVPLLITILPFIGTSILKNELFHTTILFFAIPISLIGLGMGYLTHKNLKLVGWAFLGFSLMVLGLLFESYETFFTVVGVSIVACTHLFNWRQHFVYHGHGADHGDCKKRKTNSVILEE